MVKILKQFEQFALNLLIHTYVRMYAYLNTIYVKIKNFVEVYV